MRKALALGAGALLAMGLMAFHLWSGYHWPTGSLSPAGKDRTRSVLYDVTAGVQEWQALGTPIQPTEAGGKADITVKEASSTIWLGLARIFIDGEGHISKGEVLLNTRALATFGPAAADHVLCQEIGHVLGLDHNRTTVISCMNDQAPLGSATSPDAHDAETLNFIYAHLDGSEEPTTDDPGGPPCSKNPTHPNCRPFDEGRWLTVHIFPIP